jgi:hypothetical protein
MKPEFFIIRDGQLDSEPTLDSRCLSDHGVFKTLSLLEATRAGLSIPPSVLLLDRSYAFIGDVASRWSLPMMIRMDYRSFPKVKPLGGIPIYSLAAVESVSEFLFSEQLYPLLHPHIDRFTDIFSVGILLTRTSSEVQIEIVGRGFDASDLRLGTAIPHESFAYDIHDDSISKRRQISSEQYQRERAERAKRIVQFQRYVDFANHEGRLLPSVEQFSASSDEIANAAKTIPEHFMPLGRREIRTLAGLALKLQLDVLPKLPHSESFVASFSLVPERGWVLWDVYGHWYKR